MRNLTQGEQVALVHKRDEEERGAERLKRVGEGLVVPNLDPNCHTAALGLSRGHKNLLNSQSRNDGLIPTFGGTEPFQVYLTSWHKTCPVQSTVVGMCSPATNIEVDPSSPSLSLFGLSSLVSPNSFLPQK